MLHSLSPENLDHFIESLKPLYGFRFQEVQMSEQDLLIGLWGQGDLHWIFFDLEPRRPIVFLLPDPSPVKIKNRDKPLKLFLKAHGVGLTFIKAERKEHEGRILHFYFQSPKSPDEFNCEVEARLFPKGCNVIVKSKGKTISLEKVKEPLQLTADSKQSSVDGSRPAVGGSQTTVSPATAHGSPSKGVEIAPELSEIFSQWLEQRRPKSKDNQQNTQKLIEKKQKAIAKVEEELQSKSESQYQELGEWLKANQTLKVPKHYVDLIDNKKSLSENMAEAFRKSKQAKEKIERTKERLEELKDELKKLERGEHKEPKSQQKKKAPEYKGRLLKLEENLEARAGKSGADNLALLRQARAWDFWVHLKDLPGSHAILFRNKNQKVSDHEIRKVASWLVELSLKNFNKASSTGEKYEALVTECRFVRPIKGDKLGRVNYQNERVLSFTYPHQ